MAQKRAARGSGMIRQRSNGSWEARYTAGRDPGTGKQIQKSIYGKTQDEVRRKLLEITKDIDDGIYTDSRSMTVGAWLDLWVDEYTINLKDTTLRSYKDHIRLHIKPGLGAVKINKLSPIMIQKFYNKLLTDGRCFAEGRKIDDDTPKGLSPKTVKNIHNVLHKALKQATKPPHSLIKYNPADAVELPKTTQREMSVLSGDDIVAFLNSLKDDWHYPIFYVDIFSGLRRGELLGLQWKNIDFDNKTITVTAQIQRERKKGGKLRLVPLKNDRPRTIYPPPSVFEILKEHKDLQDALREKIICNDGTWEDNDAVFTNEKGGWLEGSAVYRSLQRHLKKLGIDNVRLHDLRHTYATVSISEGVDIKTLQESLGHHDPGFTLRVYGHAVDTMKRNAADKMEAYTKRININKTE